MIMMNGTIGRMVDQYDDEKQLTKLLPEKFQTHCAAVGSALAVHYNYGPQMEGLRAHDDELLEAYRKIALLETSSINIHS